MRRHISRFKSSSLLKLPLNQSFDIETGEDTAKMEDFVAAVKLYSDDKNWTQLVECINSSVETIVKNASKIDAAIAALDPVQHTIGFMGILYVFSLGPKLNRL